MKFKVVDGAIKHGDEGEDAKLYEAGDEIELTKEQAFRFGSKLEAVKKPEPNPKAECPHCQKDFVDLEKHIAKMHPDESGPE